MRILSFQWIGFCLFVLFLSGCCSSGPCLDKYSGRNKNRVFALRAKRKVVINDNVSSPKRDRTDWWYTALTKPGKLKVFLHWDNGSSRLELDVFDMMGAKIQGGRPWGTGGLRALVAVEDRGRYYIRVRAATADDESHYSLRLIFKQDQLKDTCSNCQEEERKCVGAGAYSVCYKINEKCMAWSKPFACPTKIPCKNGKCGSCPVSCQPGEKRCTDSKSYKVCYTKDNCPAWSAPKKCGRNTRCRRGRCHRRGVKPPPVVEKPKPPPSKPSGVVKAKVISIYKYRDKMTLHIDIGVNPSVKPGQIGTVLQGGTDNPLPGGTIKITRVSGRYAIATTSLERLGINRWVHIKTR